ncbi:MAG: DNA-binding domain-containing protein [Prolixibacteraceae bacterium]
METILHRIKAYLYNNPVASKSDSYIARVSSERSLGIADICDSAVNRGGAEVSSALMQHGVSLFLKEMGYLLCDGYSVNTGYFTATPQIKGAFANVEESFHPERHRIRFRFKQGEILRNDLSSIEVEMMGAADSGPAIFQVTDVKTGSVNNLLSPNRSLKIKGRKIRVVGDNDETGIWFVNQLSGESIGVDPADLVINNPSELIIIIPELKAGTYKLQLSTRFSKHCVLRKPRTTVFEKELTVK